MLGQGLRGVMEAQLKAQLPEVPAAVPSSAYGSVALTDAVTLLASLTHLTPHGATQSAAPQPMEDYFIG